MKLVHVLRTFSCCLLLTTVCASSSSAHGAALSRASSAAASQKNPLESLIESLGKWNEAHDETFGEIARGKAKEHLLGSLWDYLAAYPKADNCSQEPSSPLTCVPEHAHWGVSIALAFRGASPGSWSAPRPPRHLIQTLTAGGIYSLACYAFGDTVDGVIKSNLWYELPGGGWVNAGWFAMGSDFVALGVSHC